MKIGFIGLGNMGGPMALNLMKAGHELLVHDVRRETAAAHLDKGARWAASPREAAVDRELILTSLPGPVEVERVATGADGVIHGAARGRDLRRSLHRLAHRDAEDPRRLQGARRPRARRSGERWRAGRRARNASGDGRR